MVRKVVAAASVALLVGCAGASEPKKQTDWTDVIIATATSPGFRLVLWEPDETFQGVAAPSVVAMPSVDGEFLEHVFDPNRAQPYPRIVRVDCDKQTIRRFVGGGLKELPQDPEHDPSWADSGTKKLRYSDAVNYCDTDWSTVKLELTEARAAQ